MKMKGVGDISCLLVSPPLCMEHHLPSAYQCREALYRLANCETLAGFLPNVSGENGNSGGGLGNWCGAQD